MNVWRLAPHEQTVQTLESGFHLYFYSTELTVVTQQTRGIFIYFWDEIYSKYIFTQHNSIKKKEL